VIYVDLWPALANDDALDKQFTHDNLHLTAEGYRAWSDVLRQHVADHASR
jgi:lysophospholipase L1-like esterase